MKKTFKTIFRISISLLLSLCILLAFGYIYACIDLGNSASYLLSTVSQEDEIAGKFIRHRESFETVCEYMMKQDGETALDNKNYTDYFNDRITAAAAKYLLTDCRCKEFVKFKDENSENYYIKFIYKEEFDTNCGIYYSEEDICLNKIYAECLKLSDNWYFYYNHSTFPADIVYNKTENPGFYIIIFLITAFLSICIYFLLGKCRFFRKAPESPSEE